MAFFECEFPTTISYRAVGGPLFSTTINESSGGWERRMRNWLSARGKWTVSLETPVAFAGNRQQFIDLLLAFFLNVGGKADAFRLKDHKDFTATSQVLGTGDGSKTTFQLIKTYPVGSRVYVRNIYKPIAPSAVNYQGATLANTVKLYLAGVLQSSGYTLDATTGVITFTTAPGAGVTVSADFQFHHAVRFDTDDLAAQIEESDLANGPIVSWNSIPLIGVRAGTALSSTSTTTGFL